MLDPNKVNFALVNERLQRMNEKANYSVAEVQKTGRLRVSVEAAFRNPQDLVDLICQICLLKRYAESAAAQFGEPMTFDAWIDVFRIFDAQLVVLPSGGMRTQ